MLKVACNAAPINLKSQTSIVLCLYLTQNNPRGLCRNGNRTVFKGGKKSICKELSNKANLHPVSSPGLRACEASKRSSCNKCLMTDCFGSIKKKKSFTSCRRQNSKVTPQSPPASLEGDLWLLASRRGQAERDSQV